MTSNSTGLRTIAAFHSGWRPGFVRTRICGAVDDPAKRVRPDKPIQFDSQNATLNRAVSHAPGI